MNGGAEVTLVLVDIDGTLVDCRGRGGSLLGAALRDTYGVCGDVAAYEFGGKVDPQIVFDLVAEVGIGRDAALARLGSARQRYLELLATGLPLDSVRLLPHVRAFLQRLAARPEVRLGLLTGNWEPSARHKLAAHDLNSYFVFGAFGEDGFDRVALPPVAIARAESHCGRRFARERTWVVGDSRQDVACARAHGLRSLAVATGRTSAADLERAGAEAVVPTLEQALTILLAAIGHQAAGEPRLAELTAAGK